MDWILIAELTSPIVMLGLLVIIFDLDARTNFVVRYGLWVVTIAFGLLLGGLLKGNPNIQAHADLIVFVQLGTAVIAFVLYMILHQWHLTVIRYSGSAVLLTIVLFVVGSCQDTRRQRQQIDSKQLTTTAGK